MPILNYTTKIPSVRTIGEIQTILAKHGAKAIMTEYDDAGNAEALSFKVVTQNGELGFRLPINIESLQRILIRQNVDRRFREYDHAVKVAWRIVKDWVEAQMAILETEMVAMEQIFLPYMITPSGQTLYSAMRDRGFYLEEGKAEGTQR
ncbi:MAG: hypothetical protein KAV87_24660 [Desulfobacteraceae bacterium]|nr:hypothetical protein [Desulfobacteraceae bacterium]